MCRAAIIQRKIAAFKNTQKITKARKWSAAAKPAPQGIEALAARPYAQCARRAC
ncbi:MAG: F0F1 ATP synthase subunit gamma [Nitrospira sp.]|nr:F0F1 ATP synthase subunit gamma [Nitrospira sp.]